MPESALPGLGLFVANNGSLGFELWATDPSAEDGVSLVKDFIPGGVTYTYPSLSGPHTATSPVPTSLTSLGNGKVLFQAADVSSITSGQLATGLWMTDGTTAGTVLLKPDVTNIMAGFGNPMVEIASLGNGSAVFVADTGTIGRELWFTDGTAVGTRLVKDIYPGGTATWITMPGNYPSYIPIHYPSLNPQPKELTSLGNGKVLFSDYGSVWVTDGTTSGTTILATANVSSIASFGDGRALVVAYEDGNKGYEVFLADTTAGSFTLLKDIFPGGTTVSVGGILYLSPQPQLLTPDAKGKIYFIASDTLRDSQLWVTDGTSLGTVKLKSLPSDFTPKSMAVTGTGQVVFAGSSTGTGAELWVTSGMADGTLSLLKDIRAGANGSDAANLPTLADGRILFSANDSTGAQLWITDGTPEGTRPATTATGLLAVSDIAFIPASGLFTEQGDTVDFNALTVDQKAAIQANAELYQAGDGNDVVALPDAMHAANLGQATDGSTILWNDDILFSAGRGQDQVTGTARRDRIYGGDDKDIIHGAGGDDVLLGGGGDDVIYGGEEDDEIWGDDILPLAGFGGDTLYGDAGNDKIYGGHGSDSLDGGAGADELYGGDGDDVLDGRHADRIPDRLSGGAGRDLYLVDNGDVVMDFEVADTIFLSTVTQADGVAIYFDGAKTFVYQYEYGGAVPSRQIEIEQGLSAHLINVSIGAYGVALTRREQVPTDPLAAQNVSVNGRQLPLSVDLSLTVLENWLNDQASDGIDDAAEKFFRAMVPQRLGSIAAELLKDFNLTVRLGDFTIAVGKILVAELHGTYDNNALQRAADWVDAFINLLDPPGATYAIAVGGVLWDHLFTSVAFELQSILNAITIDTRGDNDVQGTQFPDFIYTGAGNDTVRAMGGDDTIKGGSGAGDDFYSGGGGIDLLLYTSATSGVFVDLRQGIATGIEIGTDRLEEIENLTSGPGKDTLLGSDVANILDGGAGHDRLEGRGGDDVLRGGDGDDILVGGLGSNLLDGGAGWDVVDDSLAARRGVLTQNADGSVSLARGGAVDTYQGVEEVRFLDGRLVFALESEAAQVLRLYQAALNRAPDQTGLNDWIGRLQAGLPLSQLADAFIQSEEFAVRFGTGLSSAEFVDRLYVNTLGRQGEAAGLASWTGLLDSGAWNRAQVLVGFSESEENVGNTVGLVQAGIWDRSESAAEVARLYDTVLGRAPDVVGMQYWRSVLDAGGSSLAQLADGFTASAEFQRLYGALDTRGFVEALYVNTLDRPGEDAGIASWVYQIDQGMARSMVVLGFSESAEHRTLTAAMIGGETSDAFGIVFV